MKQPQIDKQTAAVIVLECMIIGPERLFGEKFDNDPTIDPDNLKTLREVRDTQLERLRENLRHARKIAA